MPKELSPAEAKLKEAEAELEQERAELDTGVAEILGELRDELKERGHLPKTAAAIAAINDVITPTPMQAQVDQFVDSIRTINESLFSGPVNEKLVSSVQNIFEGELGIAPMIRIKEPGKKPRPATPEEQERIVRGWSPDDAPLSEVREQKKRQFMTDMRTLDSTPEPMNVQRVIGAANRNRLPTKREKREMLQRVLEQTLEEIVDLSTIELRRPWPHKATDLGLEIEHLAESLRHETDHHATTADLRHEAERVSTRLKGLATEVGAEMQDTLLNSGLTRHGARDRRFTVLIPRLPRRHYTFDQEEKDTLGNVGTMDDAFLHIFNALGDDESRLSLEELAQHDLWEAIQEDLNNLSQLEDDVYARDDVTFDEEGCPIIDDELRMKEHSDWMKIMGATQRKVRMGVEFLYPMLQRIRRRGRFRGCKCIEPFGDDLRVTLIYTPYSR